MNAPAVDADRVIADLRELARRTGDERGAQRVCWTDGWRDARELLHELLAEIGLEAELDEAGNLWARLGAAGAPGLALGSHLDSVPDGGWLDGALGVMAALGVLRAWSQVGKRPPRPLVLVDWADEEGARFGRSLLGSSAFSGSLDPASVRELRDDRGVALPQALAESGVDLDRVLECGRRRRELASYLELHIEQGPRLEARGLGVAAVSGCAGVERVRFRFRGQAAHAGTTPMEMRRDAGLAAAQAAGNIDRIPFVEGGVATSGELTLRPGIPTAVPGEALMSVDLRHPDGEALARMLASARDAAERAAQERRCEIDELPLWRIEPIAFDPELVRIAREACAAVAGEGLELVSGALHDAAEVARVLPAALVFAASKHGLSHTREEDTEERDLRAAIEAFGAAAARAAALGAQ